MQPVLVAWKGWPADAGGEKRRDLTDGELAEPSRPASPVRPVRPSIRTTRSP